MNKKSLLSPTLFPLYISDKEEYKRRGPTGKVVLRRKKCLVLAYADNLAMLAKTEDIRGMLRNFRQ